MFWSFYGIDIENDKMLFNRNTERNSQSPNVSPCNGFVIKLSKWKENGKSDEENYGFVGLLKNEAWLFMLIAGDI